MPDAVGSHPQYDSFADEFLDFARDNLFNAHCDRPACLELLGDVAGCVAKPLPRSLPRSAVEALLETVARDRESKRKTDWAERDLAIILSALLTGLRADELRQANVGDIRTTGDGGAVIHVKGKGGKDRSLPVEAELLSVIETYLDSRAIRIPDADTRRATRGATGLSRWSTG